MEKFLTLDETLKEDCFVKDSFDKLINIYFPHNRSNIENNSIDNDDKEYSVLHKKKIDKKKSNDGKDKFFLNKNFCNELCQVKYEKILTKIKNGEIDINKLNWTKDVGGQNLIQNLVNYYYNAGYSEGISNSQSDNKN